MKRRHLTTGNPLPALLVDCVEPVSAVSTRGGCFRPRVTICDNFDESARLGRAR